mmetsp:Transcript_3534/g.12414  ORF Transcript_3534/g.12414 Transcript_3534/m.12414 type:complete len:239 (-) Transcript_3534:594-1310(-)
MQPRVGPRPRRIQAGAEVSQRIWAHYRWRRVRARARGGPQGLPPERQRPLHDVGRERGPLRVPPTQLAPEAAQAQATQRGGNLGRFLVEVLQDEPLRCVVLQARAGLPGRRGGALASAGRHSAHERRDCGRRRFGLEALPRRQARAQAERGGNSGQLRGGEEGRGGGHPEEHRGVLFRPDAGQAGSRPLRTQRLRPLLLAPRGVPDGRQVRQGGGLSRPGGRDPTQRCRPVAHEHHDL